MMENHSKVARATVCLGALGAGPAIGMWARGATEGILKEICDSQESFHELMQTPDHAIPYELLESAKCIAIIPGVKKACSLWAENTGRAWIAGGSFGLQIGASSTDFFMIFRNREGFQRLLRDKFTIGADATAAAGPVGRDASAAMDAEKHAQILTYSRSPGFLQE